MECTPYTHKKELLPLPARSTVAVAPLWPCPVLFWLSSKTAFSHLNLSFVHGRRASRLGKAVAMMVPLLGMASTGMGVTVGNAVPVSVTVDATGTGSLFEHKWKRSFGSRHASLTLRKDWRAHLVQAASELGLQGVRYHGIFDDDMAVVVGPGIYNFTNIDATWDFLLANGVRPIVELSFMPAFVANCTWHGHCKQDKVGCTGYWCTQCASAGLPIHTLAVHTLLSSCQDPVSTPHSPPPSPPSPSPLPPPPSPQAMAMASDPSSTLALPNSARAWSSGTRASSSCRTGATSLAGTTSSTPW